MVGIELHLGFAIAPESSAVLADFHFAAGAVPAALVVIGSLFAGRILDRLPLFTPFIKRVAMGGFASSDSGARQTTTQDDDLLRFETDLLRLVNEDRAQFGGSQVSLHGNLLAEARARSRAISRRWRVFQVSLRQRIDVRGRYSSAVEVQAVRTSASPKAVLQQWLTKRSYRQLIRSEGYDLGAVGVVREVGGDRYAVTLLLAQREAR